MQTYSVFVAAALVFSFSVVTGQDLECNGACVGTWKKCAGEGIPSGMIRPCCSDDDHCVEKTSKFSQCRPKAQNIPTSWPSGAVLTCTSPDPSGCDPTTVVVRLAALSAGRFAGNRDIRLDFSYADELDYQDTTCLQACQDNDECFVFNESVDGDCTLFGKNLFTTAGDLQPFFDAEVFLTKCFLPEPLCDPATREVRRINSITALDGGPHQTDSDFEFNHFFVSPVELDYTLTAAINACRLNEGRAGRCIGFAIEPSTGPDGDRVTLLHAPGPRTIDYQPRTGSDRPQVYNIEACP